MGMFDYIKFDGYPLPDEVKGINEWQTKQLNCRMDRYTISKTGELIWSEEIGMDDSEWFPPVEGCVVRKIYTGEMYFISSIDQTFREMRGEFKDGYLTEIHVIR